MGSGKIFTALTDAGLTVTTLEEHREVPWNPLGQAMIPSPDFDGEFILANDRDRIPLTYTVESSQTLGRFAGRYSGPSPTCPNLP